MTYFVILFHRPLRLRRKERRVKYFFNATYLSAITFELQNSITIIIN